MPVDRLREKQQQIRDLKASRIREEVAKQNTLDNLDVLHEQRRLEAIMHNPRDPKIKQLIKKRVVEYQANQERRMSDFDKTEKKHRAEEKEGTDTMKEIQELLLKISSKMNSSIDQFLAEDINKLRGIIFSKLYVLKRKDVLKILEEVRTIKRYSKYSNTAITEYRDYAKIEFNALKELIKEYYDHTANMNTIEERKMYLGTLIKKYTKEMMLAINVQRLPNRLPTPEEKADEEDEDEEEEDDDDDSNAGFPLGGPPAPATNVSRQLFPPRQTALAPSHYSNPMWGSPLPTTNRFNIASTHSPSFDDDDDDNEEPQQQRPGIFNVLNPWGPYWRPDQNTQQQGTVRNPMPTNPAMTLHSAVVPMAVPAPAPAPAFTTQLTPAMATATPTTASTASMATPQEDMEYVVYRGVSIPKVMPKWSVKQYKTVYRNDALRLRNPDNDRLALAYTGKNGTLNKVRRAIKQQIYDQPDFPQ